LRLSVFDVAVAGDDVSLCKLSKAALLRLREFLVITTGCKSFLSLIYCVVLPPVSFAFLLIASFFNSPIDSVCSPLFLNKCCECSMESAIKGLSVVNNEKLPDGAEVAAAVVAAVVSAVDLAELSCVTLADFSCNLGF